MEKQQALDRFNDWVGDLIAEHLYGQGLSREDILKGVVWTPEEIADAVENWDRHPRRR